MEWLIWGGAALSGLGLLGLMVCVVGAVRAKRARLQDAELRARIARLVPLNVASLLLSTVGLMAVILGIFLR